AIRLIQHRAVDEARRCGRVGGRPPEEAAMCKAQVPSEVQSGLCEDVVKDDGGDTSWYASLDATPPGQFKYGYIDGCQKQVVKWIGVATDRRNLRDLGEGFASFTG